MIVRHRLKLVDGPDRSCGSCSVCCTHVAIAQLDKPARVPCNHLEDGKGCQIYSSPERPEVCHGFLCAWIQGLGAHDDRPDTIGVMLSIQQVDDGRFALALEIEHGAVVGKASSMIAEVATQTKLPVIISDYESLPPNDRGDRVALHTAILYRSRRLVGPLLQWLAPEVALHVLVKGRAD
jgi:hypothetical protein